MRKRVKWPGMGEKGSMGEDGWSGVWDALEFERKGGRH